MKNFKFDKYEEKYERNSSHTGKMSMKDMNIVSFFSRIEFLTYFFLDLNSFPLREALLAKIFTLEKMF